MCWAIPLGAAEPAGRAPGRAWVLAGGCQHTLTPTPLPTDNGPGAGVPAPSPARSPHKPVHRHQLHALHAIRMPFGAVLRRPRRRSVELPPGAYKISGPGRTVHPLLEQVPPGMVLRICVGHCPGVLLFTWGPLCLWFSGGGNTPCAHHTVTCRVRLCGQCERSPPQPLVHLCRPRVSLDQSWVLDCQTCPGPPLIPHVSLRCRATSVPCSRCSSSGLMHVPS
jgi:hypothetical protein